MVRQLIYQMLEATLETFLFYISLGYGKTKLLITIYHCHLELHQCQHPGAYEGMFASELPREMQASIAWACWFHGDTVIPYCSLQGDMWVVI
jgi:hypothetical protein